MRFRAGTWPWLLRHELRIAWRGTGSQFQLLGILLALFWVIGHVIGLAVMKNLSLATLDGSGMLIAGLLFWFVVTLMLAGAITLAVNALYDRGDLDLLMSAPLATRTVFTVRGIGIAISAVALFAVIVSPFVNASVIHGRWQMLAAYPVMAAIGLGVTALALALTLWLVRRLGARRARVVAQVTSAFVGAFVFLLTQLQNLLPEESREQLLPMLTEAGESHWLASDSALWWPVRALFGDWLPALVVTAAGTALFILVMRTTTQAFVLGTQESSVQARPSRRSNVPYRFRHGIARNVIRKELRLILRDPNLIAKTLLQTLYLVPMLFLLMRNEGFLLALAPAIIVMLSSIAGNLAWITISGEEAPDLVGSAPVVREHVRWFKAAAAVLPLMLLGAPFVLFYLISSPPLAPIFLLFLLLALGAAAVTQVWGGKPSPERDLNKRHKQNVFLNFVELLSTFAIAGACYLALSGYWWSLIVVPFGLAGPAIAWITRQTDTV
jgi:ABC-2 type transport system permease protein